MGSWGSENKYFFLTQQCDWNNEDEVWESERTAVRGNPVGYVCFADQGVARKYCEVIANACDGSELEGEWRISTFRAPVSHFRRLAKLELKAGETNLAEGVWITTHISGEFSFRFEQCPKDEN